jgi:hypothetical protein
MLCPVIWCSDNGAILVMRAAAPLAEEEYDHLERDGKLPDWKRGWKEDEPFENKAADWGRLDGRLVVLDYAADPALLDDK